MIAQRRTKPCCVREPERMRQLRRGADNVSEGRDWTWTDDAESIAATWLRLYPSKAPQIASKVLELNKSTAKKRGKGPHREPPSEREWDSPSPELQRPEIIKRPEIKRLT
jgi:hypothetical protein